jgi:hypothetical protein
VFENRGLRRIVGSKGKKLQEVDKLHNEELHNLYTLRNIITVMELRTRLAGNVSGMGMMYTKFWSENLDQGHLGDLGVDESLPGNKAATI